MFPAPLLLFLLILISPLCLIFDGPMAYGVVTALVSLLLLIIAVRIRPGEAEFSSRLIFPVALVAAVPVLIILIQLVPSESIGLANSIWRSAGAVLSRRVTASITIDPGETLICMVRYFSLVGLMFATAAIAIERRRASWVLPALTVATTLSALMAVVAGLASAAHDNALDTVATTDAAVLGIIIAVAMVSQIRERATAASADQTSLGLPRLMHLVCLAAIGISSFAVFQYGTIGTFVALAFAIITFIVAGVIRRFQLDTWGYLAVVAVVIVIAIAALALRPGERTMDFTVALAAAPQSPLIGLTRRLLAETGWFGTGAGTFAALLPIYGDIDELAAGAVPPSAAAAIAVEMGKPFLWAALICGIVLVITLLRGAARRGRDSFYPAAGASCVVAVIVLAFNNSGLFNTAVLVISAVSIGLAIAQSKSRTV